MELSNKIGQAVGLDLPSTLVFDYPAVVSIAAYLMTKLAPRQAPAGTSGTASLAVHITDLTLPTAAPSALAAAGAFADVLIHMTVAARVPTAAFEDAGRPMAAGHDAISMVPYDRWDLEALRVSMLELLALPACIDLPLELPAAPSACARSSLSA